ncbi:MAG: hypothetical protein DRO07_02475 [Candidatus Iainarchaeum archaeon]|uniref:Uncharacterized protein n=1 Tax=Candidatus Iainarchaeum sp. TaxID=3101447 RepID=A0A497JF54_9ARCH|nr:MAG: hypothetical protein DRO07_02475 [Candidatus Diapherotrites archaeon]
MTHRHNSATQPCFYNKYSGCNTTAQTETLNRKNSRFKTSALSGRISFFFSFLRSEKKPTIAKIAPIRETKGISSKIQKHGTMNMYIAALYQKSEVHCDDRFAQANKSNRVSIKNADIPSRIKEINTQKNEFFVNLFASSYPLKTLLSKFSYALKILFKKPRTMHKQLFWEYLNLFARSCNGL